MAWIIESFAKVILAIVNGLLAFCLKLYDNIGLDIGYKIGKSEGMFDKVLPYASYYKNIFIFLAFMILVLYAVYKIIVSMTSTETKDTPVSIAVRLICAGAVIPLSYDFIIFLEKQLNVLYGDFKDILAGSLGSAKTKILSDNLANVYEVNHLFDVSLFENSFKDEFITTLILCFCGIALLVNLFKLTVEMIERYAFLGLIFYTAPLAFSTAASKDSDILKRWLQLLMSQFVLLFANLFFITIFANGLMSVKLQSSPDTKMIDFVLKMFVLLAWLIIGQKFDEQLRSLGFSVSQSGGKLASSVLGAAIAAQQVARLGTGIAKTGVSATKKGGSKVKDAFDKARMSDFSTDDGVKAALDKKHGALKGSDARDVAAKVMPAALMKGAKDYSVSKGKVSSVNQDGEVRDVGKASMYENENKDQALRPLENEHGSFVTPATSDIVKSDGESLANFLNEKENEGDIPESEKLNWQAQEDGTVLGMKNFKDKDGNLKSVVMGQAAPSYLAKGDTSIPDTYKAMDVENNNLGSSFKAGVQRFESPVGVDSFVGDVKSAAETGMLKETDFSKFKTGANVVAGAAAASSVVFGRNEETGPSFAEENSVPSSFSDITSSVSENSAAVAPNTKYEPSIMSDVNTPKVERTNEMPEGRITKGNVKEVHNKAPMKGRNNIPNVKTPQKVDNTIKQEGSSMKSRPPMKKN